VLEFPVSLIGEDYWGGLLDWIAARPLATAKISPEDAELLHVTDDVAVAVERVRESWERFSAQTVHEPKKADAE
jgi:predicted Rossmann-fold nucleotide-binding protein